MVVDQIRTAVRAGDLGAAVAAETGRQLAERRAALVAERARLPADLAGHTHRAQEHAQTFDAAQAECKAAAESALTDALAAAAAVERRLLEVDAELRQLERAALDFAWVRETLASFDPVWQALLPAERARLVELLVERVVVRPDRTADIEWRSVAG